MGKKTSREIPAEREKEFLSIYNLLKLHKEKVDAIVNSKAVKKLRTTLKNLDELIQLKALTQGQKIKDELLNDFFPSECHSDIYKDFGKVKRGRPQEDFPLDVLIYLLSQYHGNDYNSIGDFLAETIEVCFGDEALIIRLKRIKKDELIRHYNKFLSLAKTVEIIESDKIAVTYHLPLLK